MTIAITGLGHMWMRCHDEHTTAVVLHYGKLPTKQVDDLVAQLKSFNFVEDARRVHTGSITIELPSLYEVSRLYRVLKRCGAQVDIISDDLEVLLVG